MKISKRLTRISEYVDDYSNIIDVGCDHALLDIYLEQTKKDIHIVASDIKKGPLKQAQDNLNKYHTKNIELSLSDGLDLLKKECNTIVISGLGGDTIIDILKKDVNKLTNINTIVLSPNTELIKVRTEVNKLGYIIDKESYILDKGKIYLVVKFIKGHKRYSKKELFLGPIALKNKDDGFKIFCKDLLDKEIKILNDLPKKYFIKRLNIKFKMNMIEKALL